ncbi:MAG TPA: bifunctional (p)ppGpp synthetase/guanosine-3',5'-bis(diphosphate) 3'-pyrophosphohydrolase [Sedimenticola thiotaurini]|uniref:GTP pyrophosphokinase n=1 Tax=Sedimenticola thiotaurini TaxID=1543721 RepID=A0A831RPN6_9GAMM|nr:bifunctional (p)ppGpp synthetase/guanosine-3',5'-bis(diphosphate) 3'-pyrophosphohydrolase [Sedimenticola thiotaurini]
MVSTTNHIPEGEAAGAEAVETWLRALGGVLDEESRSSLRRACFLLLESSATAQAPTSVALKHAIAVADILARLGLDPETMTAAVLHIGRDETGLAPGLIGERFGPVVKRMVDDLERLGEVSAVGSGGPQESGEEHIENLRRMMLGIAEDIRVVLIVLAERLHEMRMLKQRPAAVQRLVAQETREIHAPLANRLGIWQIKWELEDLCLRYLHPDDYRRIASRLDGRRADREAFIASIITLLQEKFAEAGIEAEISGRPKHIYSIWRKMQRKGVDFDQIFDLRALRVLVDSVADCYAVLGIVHGTWRHIPGEFDDYIATPKPNMYRSIHTAVIGPDERPLEIQIRTREMHQHAELGVAAHWRYKESGRDDPEFERRIALMRNWLERKDDSGEDGDAGILKAGFESGNIYVLTPQGRVIELPRGSTPVDFAYAIHSDVGHHCRGAKVDGRIVPLSQPLESGQTVEILTVREGGPSRDWLSPHLGYIHTSRARNRIRHWFKQQDYSQHLEAGRAALEREIERLGVARPDLEQVAAHFNFRKADDLLAAVGRGEVSPVQVAGMGGRPETEPPGEHRPAPRRPRRRAPVKGAGEVIVEGEEALLTNIARCCKPVPYDGIIGFITRGRGVTVHRRDCPVIRGLKEKDRGRLVSVEWAEQPSDATYPVDIQVLAGDRKGLLRDVSAILTNEEVDVLSVATRSDRKRDQASMRFTIEISDMRQLSRILDKVAQLPDVIQVRRQV